jgi:Mn-containing catalase
MILRFNRLQIGLEKPAAPDPDGAAAVQELLGGRFGEMSTLNNYMHQSFAFREKERLAPFYDVVASITAEEFGHVELVSNTINLLLADTVEQTRPTRGPMKANKNARNSQHFIVGGPGHLVADSMGRPWMGDYVFCSGNLVLDLLHNFFLESGARTHKHRVYQMTTNTTARTMIGYLMVRGGVHQAAYGKALEEVTGVNMTKMLPLPNIKDDEIPEAKKWMDRGEHRRLYRFSPEDFTHIESIWNGTADWADGGVLEVLEGVPEGAPVPAMGASRVSFAPQYEPEEIYEIAARLMKHMPKRERESLKRPRRRAA